MTKRARQQPDGWHRRVGRRPGGADGTPEEPGARHGHGLRGRAAPRAHARERPQLPAGQGHQGGGRHHLCPGSDIREVRRHARLRLVLEEILPRNPTVQDFLVEHAFPEMGRRKMPLTARRFAYESDKSQVILLALEDVTGGKKR